LKCDGTRAETRFRLSAKQTCPFKSAGALVQSTTGSRGVRISGSNGSNAGYTMFRGSVKVTGYPLHSPVSPDTSPPVRHRVPSGFNWTLHLLKLKLLQVTCQTALRYVDVVWSNICIIFIKRVFASLLHSCFKKKGVTTGELEILL